MSSTPTNRKEWLEAFPGIPEPAVLLTPDDMLRVEFTDGYTVEPSEPVKISGEGWCDIHYIVNRKTKSSTVITEDADGGSAVSVCEDIRLFGCES